MRFRFQSMSRREIIRVLVAAALCGMIVSLSKVLTNAFAAYLVGTCFFLLAMYVLMSVLVKKR